MIRFLSGFILGYVVAKRPLLGQSSTSFSVTCVVFSTVFSPSHEGKGIFSTRLLSISAS